MAIALTLLWVGAVIFVVNLPFGYWRSNTKPLTLVWALAVHLPVPFIVVLRLAAGLGWRLQYIIPMVLCFFAGQFTGGRIRGRMAATGRPLTSCLVIDLARGFCGSTVAG